LSCFVWIGLGAEESKICGNFLSKIIFLPLGRMHK
jgi:hypothetical protein